MDSLIIKQNIQARKESEVLIELIQTSLETLNENHQKQRMLRLIYDWVFNQLEIKPVPVKTSTVPMSVSEAIKFEKQRFPFGSHAGEEIGVIPMDYLEWLADSPDHEIKEQLRRYLKSDVAKERND